MVRKNLNMKKGGDTIGGKLLIENETKLIG